MRHEYKDSRQWRTLHKKVAEMKNRTMVEMIKSMMHIKDLPYQFWAEEVNTIVYLLKKCPTKALGKITQFEAYNGRKPEITHLNIFGSMCYVHIPSSIRHKLERKSQMYICWL